MPEHDDETYRASLLEDMKSLSPEYDDWLSQHRYLEQLKSTRVDMESKRVPYELTNQDEDNYRGIVESVEEASEQLDRLQAKFEARARTVASELSHKLDNLVGLSLTGRSSGYACSPFPDG